MKSRCLFCAALLWSSLPLPAFAWCSGGFDGPASQTLPQYDPFAAVNLRVRVGLSVRNWSEAPCQFRVFFTRVPASGEFAPNLHYLLVDQNGAGLLRADMDNAETNRSLLSPLVSGSSVGLLEFYLDVARGQISLPGTFTDRVAAILYATDRNIELDRRTLQFTLPVPSVSIVNIAGGGLSTSINFGKLEAGKARSVILEARANEPYTVKFTSQHNGRMLLDPPVAGQNWAIDYQLRIDGASADLANTVNLSADSTSSGQRSHNLEFKIMDVGNKRAGIYKDVVTAIIAVSR